MGRATNVLLVLLFAALCGPLSPVDAADNDMTEEMALESRMTYNAFARIVYQVISYDGRRRSGVSRKAMKAEFFTALHARVMDILSGSLEGPIALFAEKTEADYGTCGDRPALTMADVTDLAKKSFNLTTFSPSIPPCNNGGQIVACSYDTGSCCQRPQVEFIGRYYDTALAAMALGATKDEAFAPLTHARFLAFTLESCDPDINFEGDFELNDLKFQARSGRRKKTMTWSGTGLSLIALPPSYEVLYELYNTMLIERLRSRKMTSFPTQAQMKVLQDRVYYKKLIARIARMNLELRQDLVFPTPDDFAAAGLVMSTSARMQTPPTARSNVQKAGTSANQDTNFVTRLSLSDISVYERRTRRRETLNIDKCNHLLQHQDFFQFKVTDSVFNKYEACCANECYFMAKYGGSFSAGSANCCAGCNRASCQANNAVLAETMAQLGAIEAPSKSNAGAAEITITV